YQLVAIFRFSGSVFRKQENNPRIKERNPSAVGNAPIYSWKRNLNIMNLFNFKKMYNTNLYLFFVFMLILLSSCSKKENNKILEKEVVTFCLNDFMKDDIIKVPVEKRTITESILLNAKVEANPDKLVHFVSLVSGVI